MLESKVTIYVEIFKSFQEFSRLLFNSIILERSQVWKKNLETFTFRFFLKSGFRTRSQDFQEYRTFIPCPHEPTLMIHPYLVLEYISSPVSPAGSCLETIKTRWIQHSRSSPIIYVLSRVSSFFFFSIMLSSRLPRRRQKDKKKKKLLPGFDPGTCGQLGH